MRTRQSSSECSVILTGRNSWGGSKPLQGIENTSLSGVQHGLSLAYLWGWIFKYSTEGLEGILQLLSIFVRLKAQVLVPAVGRLQN